MKKWPPNANTTGYCGPYPVNEIQQARSKLIQCLMPPHGSGLARVLPKIGIDSCFGSGYVPPPADSMPNGLTTSGNYSLASDMSPPIKVSTWTPLQLSRSVSVQDTKQHNVYQRDQTQQEGIRPSDVQSASITRRRYSELSSASDVPVKMLKDNGVLMASKHSGQGDGSVTQNIVRIGETSSSYSTTNLPPSHVYKCDYCRVTAKSDTEITNHLTRSRHASASEYSVLADGDSSKSSPELQAVEQMLAIKNPNRSNYAALVIACPECRNIFDDIFTCGTHNKYEHGESAGCYAICPVIHSEKVEVGDTSCAVCQQQFSNHNDLVDHWLALPDHCPMPQSTDSRVFLVQTCPTCKRTFNDDFLDCVIHMATDHGTVTSVEVRHVMLPQRREHLPPFSCNRHSTGGLRDEAIVLSNLQNCFEQNAINARLEQIQKILAGIA